jgi:hypothetical protein
VAVAVISPIAGERMIAMARRQRPIVDQSNQNRSQVSIERARYRALLSRL